MLVTSVGQLLEAEQSPTLYQGVLRVDNRVSQKIKILGLDI
jgi:hypothetical protein